MEIYNKLDYNMQILIDITIIKYYNKFSFNITKNRVISPLDKQCAICHTKFIKNSLINSTNRTKCIIWELKPREKYGILRGARYIYTTLYLNFCQDCYYYTLNYNTTIGWDEWEAIDYYLYQLE